MNLSSALQAAGFCLYTTFFASGEGADWTFLREHVTLVYNCDRTERF